MNQKELKEIRKRFNPDYSNINRIYGCYVTGGKQIVTYMDLSTGLMEKEEADMYLKLLKKAISGNLGRNLIDIEFTTRQVEDSDEHRLLQGLRLSHLEDENLRNLLYDRIIESLDMEDKSYVILVAADSYDVPFKGKDDELWDEGSDEVFDYIVCGIYPVKDGKVSLKYSPEDKTFKGMDTGHILASPELGFMFPAFDDRTANIYNALYYSRSLLDIREDFLRGIFNVEKMPLSAGMQKNTFRGVMETALGEECNMEVVKAVHGQLRDCLEIHKENKDPEQPEIFIEDVDFVLRKSGVPEEKIESFNEACSEAFGNRDILNPTNIMESKKFHVETPRVSITVDPEYAYSIETRIIDGNKYLLIPAGEGVEVNGIAVEISDKEQ